MSRLKVNLMNADATRIRIRRISAISMSEDGMQESAARKGWRAPNSLLDRAQWGVDPTSKERAGKEEVRRLLSREMEGIGDGNISKTNFSMFIDVDLHYLRKHTAVSLSKLCEFVSLAEGGTLTSFFCI